VVQRGTSRHHIQEVGHPAATAEAVVALANGVVAGADVEVPR
jgi:hypothetical protein